MKYNRLGNTGLLVSELSFGSWVTFDSAGGDGKVVSKENASRKQAAEASYNIMKRAYEGGVNFFDNAEAYANGDAELTSFLCETAQLPGSTLGQIIVPTASWTVKYHCHSWMK